MSENKYQLISLLNKEHLNMIRVLFHHYLSELDVNLCFQDIEKEIEYLPGKYGEPDGCLLLLLKNKQSVGCIALRKMSQGVCEMKRLYIEPEFRGLGLGNILVKELIERARQKSYNKMRLDTLTRLKPAIKIYETFGFKKVPAYYDNPLDEVLYYELDL